MSVGDRLANFDIEVSKSLSSPSKGVQASSVRCLHRDAAVSQGATVRLNCNAPVEGRYLTLVVHNNKEPLNFCEMEVLATPAASTGRTASSFLPTFPHLTFSPFFLASLTFSCHFSFSVTFSPHFPIPTSTPPVFILPRSCFLFAAFCQFSLAFILFVFFQSCFYHLSTNYR